MKSLPEPADSPPLLLVAEPRPGEAATKGPVMPEREPFEVLDDLMAVIEALCPRWPERPPTRSTRSMRL